MIPIKTESAWRGISDCRNCGIRDMVLFADLTEKDFGLIHAPIDDIDFRSGTPLYLEGSGAVGIFTLRSGMVKLVRSTADGRQRIVRVLRPGDVAGLEALADARYGTDAVALTDVAVCRIPLNVIHALDTQSPRLHQRLMEKWSRSLREADDWLADLNFGTARSRVRNFL
ncbi:MAG: Crp/Fnr family transcriptional regulator, partial [Rhodoferax sp.]